MNLRTVFEMVGMMLMLSGFAFAAYGYMNASDHARQFGLLAVVFGGSTWLLTRAWAQARTLVEESEQYWGEHGPL